MQNTSSAVMAQRVEPHDSLDFFPTPPWATRALCEHVLIGGGWSREQLADMSCWEPACGEGDMARPLGEYFATVDASDVHGYGFGQVRDFLFGQPRARSHDWVITNPPFRLADEFVHQALDAARVGVAVLVRAAFNEGVERYETLFSRRRPAIFAPFVERVPMFKGRLDPKGSTATAYCWIVWSHAPHHAGHEVVRRIAPCRRKLEQPGDYPSEAA